MRGSASVCGWARITLVPPRQGRRGASMKAVIVSSLLVGFPAFAVAQASLPPTSWGAPDLQGVWDFRTATPLQRPGALADKAVLTDEEAAAFEEDFARGLGGGDFSSVPGATDASMPLILNAARAQTQSP